MTKWQRAFNACNLIFLSGLGFSMILPLVHIVAQSFSSNKAIATGKVSFWPVEFTIANYSVILGDSSIWRAFLISTIITAVGTLINLVATSTLAYPLSRTEFVLRKPILVMILITLVFSAPLIPNFLVIKSLGMLDTLWALMIPMAISAYTLFVMRSFFMHLPVELIDAARIDGCGEARIIWHIVMKMSKPLLATMTIIFSVGHWNRYAEAIYYLNDRKLMPLQVRLREIIVADVYETDPLSAIYVQLSPEGIKMAVIVVATVPIVFVYPFLQKYFVKGLLIGSIKS